MGLKGLVSELGMNVYGVVSLVAFFLGFVGILIWVGTRPGREMEACSRLALDEEDRNREERKASGAS